MAKRFKCCYCGSLDFITQEQEEVLYFYEWDKKRERYVFPPEHLYLQTGEAVEVFCRKCGRPVEYDKVKSLLFNDL